MPDFSQPFCIDCDASGIGLGAVLSQNRKPITFFSKALAETLLIKSMYEKELMALVLAIQHWWPYMIDQKFTVYTDQNSLRYLLEQRITSQNQQNWLAKLLGDEFDNLYKPGASNKVANALSQRLEEEEDGGVEINVLYKPYWQDVELVKAENQQDPTLKKIMEELRRNPKSHGNYTLENGKLHYKGRMVLSSSSSWIPKLLQEYHTTPMGGHS